ncbi:MAG: NAD(P)H-dependent oxidoreductase subunit E [Candidatus Aminicenantes bacterium]|nr:MAG: NAD(P)H-dependent oxidoreductase subunit E [Candidatus Aminicenantes bacterium]
MSPEFSEKTKKKIEEIVARYPQKEAAILPILHITQQEFGSISAEEEKLVARILGIKPISVRELVTFYTMFPKESLGKYHIQVCSNLSCSLLGAGNFVDYLVEKLGIKPGETTPDKKFTLSTVECLGACERAPCMMINFNYYGEMDPKKVDEILDGLK